MSWYPPVFEDGETPIAELLEQVGTDGWFAEPDQVSVVQAAHAIGGEMWAPQLTPYVEWEWRTEEGAVQDAESHDLWRLRTGVPDELRERIAAGQKKALEEKLARQRELEAAAAQVAVELPQLFGVKEGADGLVLAKVDLREYAKHGNSDANLVVVLPSQVGGVPVTRIGADAFSRFNVRGIGVRLLVVPDSVTAIDAKAFSNLAAEVIFVGAGCRHLGEQPLERWDLRPVTDGRAYVVSRENPWWSSHEGSILSKDGAELSFLAPPYGARVRLPDGVRRVGPSAFAKWDAAPEVVRCGAQLGRVASRQWDAALWLCPQEASALDALKKRNVRLASPDAVEEDGCWYDFDARGAVLVAGPPAPPTASQSFARAAAGVPASGGAAGSSAGVATAGGAAAGALAGSAAAAAAGMPAGGAYRAALVLPHEVAGRPLAAIAPEALVTAPETLVLPEGLVEVGEGNACKGTRRLSLPSGLRRIGAHGFCSRELEGVTSIPASVESVGEGCFEYGIVRLEHVGLVAHISANQLLNCFVERSEDEVAALPEDPLARVPFDLARYDELLSDGANLPERLAAVVHRLAVPVGLDPAVRAKLVEQLRSEADAAMAIVAREGDASAVAKLVDAGFIDEALFDAQIELLRRANRTDCVMLLMERRHGEAAPSASVKSRFAL